MNEEELQALVQQAIARESARQGVYTPSFLQVDNQTGEVQQVGPAAPARQAPDPAMAATLRSGESGNPRVGGSTLVYNAEEGQASAPGRPENLQAAIAEQEMRGVGGGQAVLGAMEEMSDLTRDDRVRSNPGPAASVPVSTAEQLEILPTQAEPGSPVQLSSENGRPVLIIQTPDGPAIARTRGALITARAQGWIDDRAQRQYGPTLPESLPGPSGAGGGRLETTVETTLQAPASAEALGRAGDANRRLQKAQIDVDQGNLQASSAAVGARQQVAGLVDQQAEEAARQAQDRANQIQMRAARLEQAIDDVATRRIDPEQFLGSPGNRIGAVIAVALGQLGSVLTGGPNTALQIINASIDRNIAAQRANMEHERAGVGMRASALNQMRDLYQDQAAAEQATRALQLQAMINRLDTQLAGMGPMQLAAGQELRNALLEQRMAAQALAAERSAATMRIRATTREQVPAGQAQGTALAFAQPRSAAPPQQAPAASDPGEQALDQLVPSTAGGRIRQTVDRATARERARRPQAQQPAAAVQAPLEIPSPGEVNLQDLDRATRLQSQADRNAGGVPRYAHLTLVDDPAARETFLAAYQERNGAPRIRALDGTMGRMASAAQAYFDARERYRGILSGVSPGDAATARGELRTALSELSTVSRQLNDMGTAGSVGELHWVDRIVPSDEGGWTRFLGPGLDNRLNQLEGHLRVSYGGIRALTNSYGLEPSTVLQSALRAPRTQRTGYTGMGERPR